MMRLTTLRWLPLLILALLPALAHADAMDQFSVTSTGVDIEFALPASVTVADSLIGSQYAITDVAGTLNGVSSTIALRFIFPGNCAVCDTLFFNVTPDDPSAGASTNYEFGLPALYQLTYPTPDTTTISYTTGLYSAPYIITAYTDVQPGTITVTAQNTAATPEVPSLWLFATGVLGSVFFLRRSRPAANQ